MSRIEDQIYHMSEVFGALANPIRASIVAALLASKSGMCVHDLSVALAEDARLIKKYIGFLEEAGIVTSTTSTRSPIYQADPFAEAIFNLFGLDSTEKLLKVFRKFIVNPPPDK